MEWKPDREDVDSLTIQPISDSHAAADSREELPSSKRQKGRIMRPPIKLSLSAPWERPLEVKDSIEESAPANTKANFVKDINGDPLVAGEHYFICLSSYDGGLESHDALFTGYESDDTYNFVDDDDGERFHFYTDELTSVQTIIPLKSLDVLQGEIDKRNYDFVKDSNGDEFQIGLKYSIDGHFNGRYLGCKSLGHGNYYLYFSTSDHTQCCVVKYNTGSGITNIKYDETNETIDTFKIVPIGTPISYPELMDANNSPLKKGSVYRLGGENGKFESIMKNRFTGNYKVTFRNTNPRAPPELEDLREEFPEPANPANRFIHTNLVPVGELEAPYPPTDVEETSDVESDLDGGRRKRKTRKYRKQKKSKGNSKRRKSKGRRTRRLKYRRN
jgi:hypothetical protein